MRLELLHPAFVHFPIALLLVGSALRLLAFFIQKRSLLITAWTVLGIGVCFAWITVGLGQLANFIVKGNLCNLDVLDDHSGFAYTTAYIFTGTVLLDWIRAKWFSMNKVLSCICFFLYIAAPLFLAYTGYLGGSLVYDQGAAVEKCCRPGLSK